MIDIEVKDDEEETETSMIMHTDEYFGGEKVDLQARLWNQFVRPKYIEELDMDQRRNKYTCAILVTEEMVQHQMHKVDRLNKLKESKASPTAASQCSSILSTNSQSGPITGKTELLWNWRSIDITT